MEKKHWIIIGIVVVFGWYFLFVSPGVSDLDVFTDVNTILNSEGMMLADMDAIHNVTRSGKYLFNDYVIVSGTGTYNNPIYGTQSFPVNMSLNYKYSVFGGWEFVSVNQ